MENKPEKTNKGGRPKHKNPLEKIAPSRFSISEYETIKAKAMLLKISVSTYIRSMTLQGSIRNLYSEEEQKAKRQLIGMANNLNQLLKSVNTYGLENLELQVKMQLTEIDKILEKYKYGSNSESERKDV
jgi:predicted transcriptional regulator